MKKFRGFGGMKFSHEQCECGKCRCQHVGGFGAAKRGACVRYTWPGKTIEVKHGKTGKRS